MASTLATIAVITGFTSAIASALDPALAQDQLTIPESRTLAFNLLNAKQPRGALAIADALLERDDTDVKAWLVKSRAERLLGDINAAKASGKRAWRLAQEPEDRFTSAMLTAQAVSSDGNKIGGQLWLRRAAQVAPNDKLKATAVRDLRFVRGSSPVTLQFDLSVAPSSNINNGSKSDRIEVFGLPFALSGDAQALSGIEYTAGARLSYKLPDQGAWRLTTGVALNTRHYSLSSSARALAPNVSGSDYAFQELTASLSASKQDKDRKGALSLSLNVGHNWYGGSPLTRFAGVSAGRQLTTGKTSSLGFNLSYQRQWRQDNDLRSADVVSLSTTWAKSFKDGSALWVTGYMSDTASASASIANETIGASIRYAVGEPIFAGTGLELSLGYSTKTFDEAQSPFALREDDTIDASATMIFNDLNYMGFAPTAQLRARTTSSTLGQFSLDDLGMKLGLRSTF